MRRSTSATDSKSILSASKGMKTGAPDHRGSTPDQPEERLTTKFAKYTKSPFSSASLCLLCILWLRIRERETGLEPATNCLGSNHSTTELLPLEEVQKLYPQTRPDSIRPSIRFSNPCFLLSERIYTKGSPISCATSTPSAIAPVATPAITSV